MRRYHRIDDARAEPSSERDRRDGEPLAELPDEPVTHGANTTDRVEALLRMQQTAGNRAVGRLLARNPSSPPGASATEVSPRERVVQVPGSQPLPSPSRVGELIRKGLKALGLGPPDWRERLRTYERYMDVEERLIHLREQLAEAP